MSVDTYDAEPYAVHSLTFRRARKEHKCRACGETIRRGDMYARDFAVWDGDPHTVKRCMRCEKLYQALCEAHCGSDDVAPDWKLGCGHTYEDIFREPPPPELAALAFLTPDEAQGFAAELRANL